METDKSLLVLGGSSGIGRASALRFARAGWRILLAGRDVAALQREAADITARTDAKVSIHVIDILDTCAFEPFAAELPGLPDAVLCVIGLYGEQGEAQTDLAHATLVIRSNFEGPALILGVFAERFAARGSGTIVGVSSVSGERGRAKNYVYGSSKAGLTAFLSGLRHRFGKTAIRVVTVVPGFVRTRMTLGMKLPAWAAAEPAEVAEAIYRAVDVRPRDVIYVKSIWLIIMTIIRAIPEPVFKRLRL